MLSPQNNRLKLLLKPYPPRSPHSTNSSPRGAKSTDFSFKSQKSPLKTSEKSNCCGVLKALDDLNSSLEIPSRSLRISEKELLGVIENCKKNLKLARSKVLELALAEESSKSESKNSTEFSSFIKQGNDEYSSFLEYALSYEQKKTEIVLEKSKFPKVRMKEVERALNDEFSLKNPCLNISLKFNESVHSDKFKKELKELYQKSLKKWKESAQIPHELTELLENDDDSQIEIQLNNSKQLSNFLNDEKNFNSSLQNLQSELAAYKNDYQKLAAKYMYLISKVNKQDIILKRQSKILDKISKNTADLKKTFIEYFNEIKGYNCMLVETLSQKSLSRISGAEFFESEKTLWEKEKEKMCKENENLKVKVLNLEKKLKRSAEEVLKLRREVDNSENSIELNSNINDIIEIQKLRDQLRLLTFKSNDTISQYQKEQDYYTSQISKLKSENFHLEKQLSSLKSQFSELLSEKPQKSRFSQEEKEESFFLKPGISDLPRHLPQNSMETLSVGEVSSEKSVKISDIYDLLKDEIDDLVQSLKSHHIFINFYGNNFELLKKVCEFVIKIKENLCEESQFFEETINSLVNEHRQRLFNKDSGYESNSLKKITEIQAYKTKIKVKKTQIELLKQQNLFLNKTIDELREEVQRTSIVELDCIKGMIGNILKDIPKLSSDTEQLIAALMNTIGLTNDEVNQIKNARKGRKGSGFF